MVFAGGIIFQSLRSQNQSPQKPNTDTAGNPSNDPHMNSGTKSDPAILNSLVNKPAPDFELTSFDGKNVKLSDYKGRKVAIFFTEGAMCQPACWDQIKALSSDNYFSKNNIAVLTVVVDDKSTWADATTQDAKLKDSLVLLDTTQKVVQEYGALLADSSMHPGQFPGHTFVLIGKDGIVKNVIDDPNMGIDNVTVKEAFGKV